MLTSLDNNEYVKGSVIKDCMRLSRVLLRQGNNITNFDFLGHHPYVKYYGLTVEEVREKLIYFNISHKYQGVKAYYNVYRGEGYYTYSTWSVSNYPQTGDLKDYWICLLYTSRCV